MRLENMGKFDLTVIGGGPAGYVPAIRAAQYGKEVLVIEEDEIGGTCLNYGCIPTKTLVASTSLLRHAATAKRFGLEGELTYSWEQLLGRKNRVVKRLRKGIEQHFRNMGITLLREHGTIKDSKLVIAGGKEIDTENIILAPGSVPFMPGQLGIEGTLTSTDVLDWTELPESLIIVGGGVIGCEFASIFAALGVSITIVEMLPDILPGIDADVTEIVRKSLEKSRIKILTGNGAESVDVSNKSASVTLSDETVVSAESLLVAIGRKPRLSDLGLEDAEIDFTKNGIIADKHQMTNLPGVYTAGDATGKWQLAHAGSAQALVAVDHMFADGKRTIDPDMMSGCIFTHPEIATVGPGQDEWEKRGVGVHCEYSKYIANGKALGMNETQGFIKLIARDSDNIVIGVQIVGADASSLVGEAVIAVNAGIRAEQIGEMIHPHPTLSELFMEAGEAFGAGSIHG